MTVEFPVTKVESGEVMTMRSKTTKVDVGAAAFVFTDVVSSTQMLESLGDDRADRLRRLHFRILRSTVAPYRGREVKSLGDGLMVVFRSSVDALRCAVEMQRAVNRHNEKNPSGAMQIRIGVHVGESAEEQGDYFGTPVVVAKRLCDKAQGGQILISGTIRSLVGSRGNLSYRDCGIVELKGITEPIPAHEVVWQPEDDAETGLDVAEAETDPAKPSRRLRASLVVLGLGLAAIAGAAVVSNLTDVRDGGSSPRPSDATSPLRWVRLDDESELGGPGTQTIKRVIAFDGGFIGVGKDTAAGDDDAAVWTVRPDGLGWTRNRDLADALGGPGSQEVWDVEAREGSVFVAVGTDDLGGDLDAAAWLSRDGVEWSRVRHDEAVFGGSQDQGLQRVTATASGFVAVGGDTSGGDHDAAVWFTDDGVSWVREQREPTFGGEAEQHMRDAAQMKDGRLVAVGYEGLKGNYDAAAWIGRPGRWRRVPLPAEVAGGAGDQIMTAVTAFNGGLVVSGREIQGGTDAVIWHVTNEGKWTRVKRDRAFSGPGNQTIWGVTSSRVGLLASGNDSQGGGLDAMLWRSRDGHRWRRVPLDEAVFGGDAEQDMRWVTSSQTRAVAVGSDSSSGSVDAAVWVANLAPNAE
jgi:class 3 adenylate cyclase